MISGKELLVSTTCRPEYTNITSKMQLAALFFSYCLHRTYDVECMGRKFLYIIPEIVLRQ